LFSADPNRRREGPRVGLQNLVVSELNELLHGIISRDRCRVGRALTPNPQNARDPVQEFPVFYLTTVVGTA
jgi:hypothetical protein